MALDVFEFFEQHGFVAQAVDFVRHLNDGFVACGQRFGDARVFVVPAPGLRDLQDEIDVVHALPGGAVHVAVDGFFPALVDAGGIDEDDLVLARGVDAEQRVPRGLRFFAGDGDFLADEVVDEGGFADVGTTNDGDVSGARVHGGSWKWVEGDFTKVLPPS